MKTAPAALIASFLYIKPARNCSSLLNISLVLSLSKLFTSVIKSLYGNIISNCITIHVLPYAHHTLTHTSIHYSHTIYTYTHIYIPIPILSLSLVHVKCITSLLNLTTPNIFSSSTLLRYRFFSSSNKLSDNVDHISFIYAISRLVCLPFFAHVSPHSSFCPGNTVIQFLATRPLFPHLIHAI